MDQLYQSIQFVSSSDITNGTKNCTSLREFVIWYFTPTIQPTNKINKTKYFNYLGGMGQIIKSTTSLAITTSNRKIINNFQSL